MLKNIAGFFLRKRKTIEDELTIKAKIDEVLINFIREEVFKKISLDYRLDYTVNKGVIKIETDNKLIAQEIALRIRGLEERLRKEGVSFKKLLV